MRQFVQAATCLVVLIGAELVVILTPAGAT